MSSSSEGGGGPKTPAGLELAYDLEKGNIENALDAFVLSLHWSIIRTGLLQRSSTSSSTNHELTERLPPNWTQRSSTGGTRTLSLFYYDRLNPSVRYELKVIELTANDMVAVTIFRSPVSSTTPTTTTTTGNSKDSSSSSAATPATANANRPASKASSGAEKNSAAATFQIGNFIKLSIFDRKSSSRDKAKDVYEHADKLETQLYESLMEPLGLRVMGQPPVQGPYDDGSTAKNTSQSSEQRTPSRERDPLLDERFVHPDFGRRPSPLGPGMPLGPLHVPPIGGGGGLGRSDLDPLGRFGAGNVLDPRGFRPPRMGGGAGGILPGLPGGIPPGARFDPFGPPNPNRPDGGTGGQFALPNPDVERPPSSDYDDMFM